MDVTPQLLHDVEFREAKRGGYNTQDVDEFLERLAVGLERQEAQVRETRQRIEVAEARVAEAERRAAHAEQRAADTAGSDETLKRTLVLAQRTADAAIKEAQEEAARTLSGAQEQASRMLADVQESTARARAEAEEEARQAHEGAKARVLAEMHELETSRDILRGDVDALEQHLAAQRERIHNAVAALQHVLDDPDALHELPAPEVSDVVAPVEEQQGEIFGAPALEPEHEAWVPDDDSWGSTATTEPALRADDAALDDSSVGPPTEPVDMLAERDADDDAYLNELRKAMTDDSPLGPRDDDTVFERGEEPARSRFGRRR